MPIAKTKAKSSQEFVAIKEIRDDVIILEDKAMRMILMASSLNFALKSAEEQEAIILQYREFLNSLDFSVQFFIESRHLNINPYLDTLKEAGKKQVNELLKIQIREYVDFVKNFVSLTEIVSKTFYIVVPFSPPAFGGAKTGPLGIPNVFGMFGKKGAADKVDLKEEKFEEYKSQLLQRVQAVIQGLSRIGIRAVSLNTEELIELFYKLYNPEELINEGMAVPKPEIETEK
jgi:hypothetical protein